MLKDTQEYQESVGIRRFGIKVHQREMNRLKNILVKYYINICSYVFSHTFLQS